METDLIMNIKNKGKRFENVIYNEILDSVEDILPKNYITSNKKQKKTNKILHNNEYYFLSTNKYIGGHEIDLAIMDKYVYNLILKNNEEKIIGNRKKGYLMTIECKNYENNINSRIGTDLLAKNYFLNPNDSIIIKNKAENDFNWKGNFKISGTKMLEYKKKIGNIILNTINEKNKRAKEYEFVFNTFNERLKNYMYDTNIYSNNNELEKILKKDYPYSKIKINLKNFEPCNLANMKTVIDYPAIILNLKNDDLIFANYLKKVELKNVRHLMGNLIMTKSKGVIYYKEKITKNAKEYIQNHKDKITLKKI